MTYPMSASRQVLPMSSGMKRRFFSTLAVLASLSGCNPSTEDICKERLPELERTLENALTVLKDWRDDNAGRNLASGPAKEQHLPEYDKRTWQTWAEQRLLETQSYIDRIPADSRLRGARASLTEIANSFVSFHGYASQSRLGPMVRSLEQIRAESEKIGREICTGSLARP